MSARTVLVSALLMALVGGAAAQPQPKPTTPQPVAPPFSIPTPPPPLPEKTVEQLIDELESVQTQKTALDKKEQELKATLRKKVEAQTERLKKLGVAPKDAKPAEPDRVGQIIIEGNTKTPRQKILEKLDFRPGQVLNYPDLEVSRTRLTKAGFRDATVEVLPNDLDNSFKDIRVRVNEAKP